MARATDLLEHWIEQRAIHKEAWRRVATKAGLKRMCRRPQMQSSQLELTVTGFDGVSAWSSSAYVHLQLIALERSNCADNDEGYIYLK
jgi:hypothetical protein